MNTKFNQWIISATIALFGADYGMAATITWDGGPSPYTGTNWNDDVNWVGDVKPGPNDTATFISNGGTGLTSGKVLTLGAPQTIYKLEIPSWAQAPSFTIGNAADVAAGNTLTMTSAYLGPNYNNDVTITANVILGGDSIWETTEDAFIINGAVSGEGMDFAKWGWNTVSLRGANSYTGDTILNAGTLKIDFNGPASPTANVVLPASPLVLKGGTLTVTAKSAASRTQRFDLVKAECGAPTITLESSSGANLLLSLDALAQTKGGTINLKQPTGNTTINANNGYTTTNANNAAGILGGYLTVMPQNGTGPTDWASNDGVNIVAYTGYTTLAGDSTTIVDNASSNIQISNASTDTVFLAGSTVSINSLKMKDTAARMIDLGTGTLRLGSLGGILTPPSTGSLTLNNGTLTAGGADDTAGEIVVVNATTITNTAVVANNGSGAVALTKSGSGLLVLTTNNTYTGGTFVNAGTLLLSSLTNSLSPDSEIVVNGGTLNLNNSVQNLSTNFVIRGGTVTNGTITKTGSNFDAQGGTIYAILKGSVGLVKTSAGSLTLRGDNTYSGDTIVLQGSLSAGSGAIDGNVVVGAAGSNMSASFSGSAQYTIADSKNVTIYSNGSFSLFGGDNMADITIFGGYAKSNDGYINGTIRMAGGTLTGGIYGSHNNYMIMSNDSTSVISGYNSMSKYYNHTFTVSNGAANIDLKVTGSMASELATTWAKKDGAGTMQVTTGNTINFSKFDISAGVFLADNATGSGLGANPVNILAGATLGGIGFMGGVSTYTKANISVTGSSGNPAIIAPGTINSTTGAHVIGTLTVGNLAVQTNNVTFGAYSKLKVNIDAAGNTDKLVVNGTLSLATATDTLEMNVADVNSLKAGTYTLATFQQLAASGQTFDTVIGKPATGFIVYTATSLDYVIPPRTTMIIVR